MEIISIPLEGDLEHKDSMGNATIIRNGDVQVMSAGTGIKHSEYNKNATQLVKFLQIWVFPNKRNVTPRYDQITLDLAARKNKLQQILSPNAHDAGVWNLEYRKIQYRNTGWVRDSDHGSAYGFVRNGSRNLSQ